MWLKVLGRVVQCKVNGFRLTGITDVPEASSSSCTSAGPLTSALGSGRIAPSVSSHVPGAHTPSQASQVPPAPAALYSSTFRKAKSLEKQDGCQPAIAGATYITETELTIG